MNTTRKLIVLVIGLAVLLSACGGVSQTDFNNAQATQMAMNQTMLTAIARPTESVPPTAQPTQAVENVPPTAQPTAMPTSMPTAMPTATVAQQYVPCSATKVDFTDPNPQHPGYRIDAGSPNEREIVNLWQRGTLETTYIFSRMNVIRDFRISSFGNMWIFPASCDSENLVVNAIKYAKNTKPSNHTGIVYFVNPDGSLVLITNDAFNYDLSNVPADPTK